jgi:DUF1365 family protein
MRAGPGRAAWLARFRARDHLGDPRASIRANLDRFLAANGIGRPHTITMLTQARVLGYVFNPLTVYWCHRPDCVVAEVHNTYGQRHAYLLRTDDRGGHSFAASVRGRAVPATARALLAAVVRHPWSTAAVSVRIRWQGVRLYLRGLPVIPRPAHQSQEGVQ